LSPAVSAKASIRTAADRLFDKMVLDLLDVKPRTVRVVLAGPDFDCKEKFKSILDSDKPLLAGVDEISFQESRAELDVVTSATSTRLAAEIYLRAKNQAMNLKVIEQSNARCVF